MNRDEPVFKKSRWGTNHYVYNPASPVGLALIVITVVGVFTVLLLMQNRVGPFAPDPGPTWSPPPAADPWPFVPPPRPSAATGTP